MRRIALASALACAACGAPVEAPAPDAGVPQVEWCTGTTEATYDPAAKQIAIFPDDYWTTDDATTLTGRHVRLEPGVNVEVPTTAKAFSSVYTELGMLDGFGTTAAITLKLQGKLDAASLPVGGVGSGRADASLVLVKVGATPEFVDFEWHVVAETVLDEDETLVVEPLTPLAPKSEYALVVSQRVKDAQGGCLAPSAATRALLEGTATDEGLVRLAPRVQGVVDALVKAGTLRARQDVSAAVVFTTQHTTEGSAAVAAHVRGQTFTYVAGACTGSAFRKCEGKFKAGDYRDAKGHLDEDDVGPKRTYDLPMTTWLPASGKASKALVFGHGLGGTRAQGALARGLTDLGWAIVAIDAPKHGGHPDKAGLLGAVEFFGVAPSLPLRLDSRQFRDNLRQATYDKLQLVQLLKAGLDLDGDGTADVDATNLAYVGISLGGIMGPELLAYAPELKAAALMVPGARLTDVLRDSSNFSQSVKQFKGSATDGDLARVFAMMQAAIERGDPAVSSPHVLANRIPGFVGNPQVLQQMVIGDDVVPNAPNRFFARSLGLPLLGDELQPMVSAARVEALPAHDTVRTGLTAGVFQFDVIERGRQATHNSILDSDVAWAQITPFLESVIAGAPELRDPYRDLELK